MCIPLFQEEAGIPLEPEFSSPVWDIGGAEIVPHGDAGRGDEDVGGDLGWNWTSST